MVNCMAYALYLNKDVFKNECILFIPLLSFKKEPHAKIHSRITKCLLMNCSLIPTLEPPGHFAMAGGQQEK